MQRAFLLLSCALVMQCKSSSTAADAGAVKPAPSPVAEYLNPPRQKPLLPEPPAKSPEPPAPAGPAEDPYAAAGFVKSTLPTSYQSKLPVVSCALYGDAVVGWIKNEDNQDLMLRFWRREDVGEQWCNAPADLAVLEFDLNFHHFMGVANGVAFIDMGTGPDAHEFSTYAMPDGNKLWEGRCTEVSFERGKLVCGRPLREGTAENCDKFEEYTRDQFSPALVEEVTVDLESWKETRTGRVECVPFQ